MQGKIVYFEDLKPENTDVTLSLVKERAAALGIGKVVLASTTGATARKALAFFQGIRLIVVPHQFDFKRKENPFPRDLVTTLRDAGHDVHFGTMLFHTGDFYGSTAPTVMANLLRCFSQGMKVCFEIVLMAADAGLVTGGEKVVAVAGTGRGADTALVMQAASSQHLGKLRVNEILAKPLNPLNIEEVLERSAQGGTVGEA
ncbi:MAG: hypothetical protein M0Z41_11335 [Peptococcaceae bacterium]|jgi:hypothetical protein|nr:hypothetical protein [Peptococcaceae bacterium]